MRLLSTCVADWVVVLEDSLINKHVGWVIVGCVNNASLSDVVMCTVLIRSECVNVITGWLSRVVVVVSTTCL